MKKNEIEKIISGIISGVNMAVLATINEGKPWVRYVMTTSQPGSLKLRTSTFLHSRKIAQIQADPHVHLTLGIKGNDMAPYVQYCAVAKVLTDEKTRHQFWSDQLKLYFQGPDDPNYCVLEYDPYLIEVWGATQDVMKPLIWTP